MSEKASHKPAFLDRLMLRRIGARALWLPKGEPFSYLNKSKTIRVSGSRSEQGSIAINLEEFYNGGTEDDRMQTNIRLDQGAGKSIMPASLAAERFICDEIAEQRGIVTPSEIFILGSPVNTLPLYEVMRSVVRATRIVADVKTIEYLVSHPEPTQVTEERFWRAL
ncbi:MAG TPA: hypothetical protein VHC21_01320 [Candidatus Saccharimonadales bacterium]|nr:hypothetical protein [Candidatus Saccharimonadales bacterium]